MELSITNIDAFEALLLFISSSLENAFLAVSCLVIKSNVLWKVDYGTPLSSALLTYYFFVYPYVRKLVL